MRALSSSRDLSYRHFTSQLTTTQNVAYHGRGLPGHGGAGQCVLSPALSTIADQATGGSFGKVFKAIDKTTGETVAIKHVCIHIYPGRSPILIPYRSTSKTAPKSWPISRQRSRS